MGGLLSVKIKSNFVRTGHYVLPQVHLVVYDVLTNDNVSNFN